MTGYFIIAYCNYWPQPTYSLDLSGLVQSHPSDLPPWDAIDGQKPEDIAELTGDIPSELYPELAYIVREPILIANSGLPAEAWGDVLDNNAAPSIKPTASVHMEESAPEKPKIPPVTGIYHVVSAGENPWALSKLYGVSQEKIRDFNPALNPNRLMVGAKIFIPGAKELLAYASSNRLIYPRKPAEITSGYGYRRHPIGGNIRFHRGIDFRGKTGDPVYAVLDGVVEDVTNQRYGLGLVVVLRHDDGLETVYGHNSKVLVQPGARVQQGDIISRVGQTGFCTGPHLHFEVLKNGENQNPLPYLTGQKNISRNTNIVRR
ncbi:MAG: peptidoglycan DD-metalloendopeptidase family protein [Candidatus Omnitrophota bacterium]